MGTPGEQAAREELQRRVDTSAGIELGWVEPIHGKKVALIAVAVTVPLQFTASIVGQQL